MRDRVLLGSPWRCRRERNRSLSHQRLRAEQKPMMLYSTLKEQRVQTEFSRHVVLVMQHRSGLVGSGDGQPRS
jgi:hypothetical protein